MSEIGCPRLADPYQLSSFGGDSRRVCRPKCGGGVCVFVFVCLLQLFDADLPCLVLKLYSITVEHCINLN